MEAGFLNLLEKLAGGNLYHCKFCRIQFWDRRKFVPVSSLAGAASAGQPPAAPAPEALKMPEAGVETAQTRSDGTLNQNAD